MECYIFQLFSSCWGETSLFFCPSNSQCLQVCVEVVRLGWSAKMTNRGTSIVMWSRIVVFPWDWVGAVEARGHVFLSSVTRGVKREENSFILNNMPGKDDKNGTTRKREDCKSPSTDGSSPEAKRLNENQGSMPDLHKDMMEASAKHVQDPAFAVIWGNTCKNRSKHQLPNKRAKIPAAKLRGASWKSWVHSK